MEKGDESSQRIDKGSLSIAQGRGTVLGRKQEAKGPTLDRQGWEPSISSLVPQPSEPSVCIVPDWRGK